MTVSGYRFFVYIVYNVQTVYSAYVGLPLGCCCSAHLFIHRFPATVHIEMVGLFSKSKLYVLGGIFGSKRRGGILYFSKHCMEFSKHQNQLLYDSMPGINYAVQASLVLRLPKIFFLPVVIRTSKWALAYSIKRGIFCNLMFGYGVFIFQLVSNVFQDALTNSTFSLNRLYLN